MMLVSVLNINIDTKSIKLGLIPICITNSYTVKYKGNNAIAVVQDPQPFQRNTISDAALSLSSLLVHKRMSILTFEGLSKTFEASTNVYFTYCVIKLYIILILHALKLPAKCFFLIIKLLGTHVIALCRA